MSNHHSRHLAIGEQVSAAQRLVEQLSEKQAIILSQSEKGKVPLVIDSRTTILVSPDCDMEAKREHYLRKYALFVLIAATLSSCAPYRHIPHAVNCDRNGTVIHIGDSVRDQWGAGKIIPWPEDSTMAVQFAPEVIMEVDGGWLEVIKKDKTK